MVDVSQGRAAPPTRGFQGTTCLLTDPLIRVRLRDGSETVLSLPRLYEVLAADRIESFPGLRPHQRHPWHALLAMLGALACLRAGRVEPPADAEGWARLLRGLTPEYPGDEPWSLVAPDDKPAFLQPVVGPAADLKPVPTPDALDMLVTARNHDLKSARMDAALPDDWLFALVTVQTAEGFLGAGNFGVSRMNGGFANRPGVGLAPPGGLGAHVMRDIRRLVALEDKILERYDLYDPEGLALLWLIPWDGTVSLPRRGLHPYYVEICRRIRLVEDRGQLSARAGNSRVARIAMTKEEAGVTGDPWTPLVTAEGSVKAMTVDRSGFHYRRLSDILFQVGCEAAPLQKFGPEEKGPGWTLVCRALVRGRGKTEGFHERRVPIPARIVARMKAGEAASIGASAQDRIRQAAAVRSCLRFGLMTLFQNGPEPSAYQAQHQPSARRAEPFLDQFQRRVDADFFEKLFAEASADSREDREAIRKAWLDDLADRARAVLRAAESGSPTSAVRRHRAMVRAESAFNKAFFSASELKPYYGRGKDAA